MKKILSVLVVLAALTIVIAGCSLFVKTYRLDTSATDGKCLQITTVFSPVMEIAGYEEGECPTENLLGTCDNFDEVGDEYVMGYFYDTNGQTAAQAKAICEHPDVNGTWHPAE